MERKRVKKSQQIILKDQRGDIIDREKKWLSDAEELYNKAYRGGASYISLGQEEESECAKELA